MINDECDASAVADDDVDDKKKNGDRKGEYFYSISAYECNEILIL